MWENEKGCGGLLISFRSLTGVTALFLLPNQRPPALALPAAAGSCSEGSVSPRGDPVDGSEQLPTQMAVEPRPSPQRTLDPRAA